MTDTTTTTNANDINDDDLPEPSLKNLIDQHSLDFVFVGGKGGVGKTTTSCCLGIQMAKTRKKVLLVSTDPAHNLSDAFCQKIGREPTPIHTFDNLFAMEIDASKETSATTTTDVVETQAITSSNNNNNTNGTVADANNNNPDGSGSGTANGSSNDDIFGQMFSDLQNSIPGIDEALAFSELMKQVQTMDFDVIVFDTAPTGHTLRLLSFPTILEKAFCKVWELKDRFGGLIGNAMNIMSGGNENGGADAADQMLSKLEETRAVINKVNKAFQDPARTTFVCVCIPEFLSIYETERLVQELSKYGIDSHNIVINQVLFPEKDAEELDSWYRNNHRLLPKEANEICTKLIARKKMQDKYIGQCFDLYGDDFHVVLMPMLDYEVRGVQQLHTFSTSLIDPVNLEE